MRPLLHTTRTLSVDQTGPSPFSSLSMRGSRRRQSRNRIRLLKSHFSAPLSALPKQNTTVTEKSSTVRLSLTTGTSSLKKSIGQRQQPICIFHWSEHIEIRKDSGPRGADGADMDGSLKGLHRARTSEVYFYSSHRFHSTTADLWHDSTPFSVDIIKSTEQAWRMWLHSTAVGKSCHLTS